MYCCPFAILWLKLLIKRERQDLKTQDESMGGGQILPRRTLCSAYFAGR